MPPPRHRRGEQRRCNDQKACRIAQPPEEPRRDDLGQAQPRGCSPDDAVGRRQRHANQSRQEEGIQLAAPALPGLETKAPQHLHRNHHARGAAAGNPQCRPPREQLHFTGESTQKKAGPVAQTGAEQDRHRDPNRRPEQGDRAIRDGGEKADLSREDNRQSNRE